MTLKILCGFRFFKISENNDFKINPFIITSNLEILKNEYSSKEFLSIIGIHRLRVFRSEPSFGYNVLEHPNPLNYNIQQFQQDSVRMVNKINSFIPFLWFVKDCRSHISEIIFYSPDKNWINIIPNNDIFSSANGESEYSTFNSQELSYAESIWKKLSEITKSRKTKIPYPYPVRGVVIPDSRNLLPYNESSRIEKSLDFFNICS